MTTTNDAKAEATEDKTSNRSVGGDADDDKPAIPEQPVTRSSVRSSYTIEDVLGNNATVGDGPAEHEMVTKILKQVEAIDLNNEDNQDEPPVDEETAELMADIVRQDVEMRESGTRHSQEDNEKNNNNNPELTPLKASPTGDTENNSHDAETANNVHSHSDNRNDTTTTKKKRRRPKLESVEQTLFGLATALGRMDTRSFSGRGSSSSSSNNNFVETSGRLAKTANVLSGHAEDDIEANRKKKAGTTDHHDKEMGNDSDDDHNTGPSSKGRTANNRFGNIIVAPKVDREDIEARWDVFKEFLDSRKDRGRTFARQVGLYVMLPSLLMAVLLFYACGNPRTGDDNTAAYSWWFLFLGMRQPVAYTMALATQSLVVDYAVLRTRGLLRTVGPIVTVFFVQARGWPFVSTFWGVYSLALNAGKTDFAKNWLWWQEVVDLFNNENPSGGVTHSRTNYLFISLFIIVGVAVALKRLFVSISLGKQTFAHFGEELAENMKKMVLIGSVAALARRIEKEHKKSILPDVQSTFQGTAGNGGSKLQALVEEEVDAETINAKNLGETSAVDAAKKFINEQTTVQENSSKGIDAFAQEETASNPDLSRSMQVQLSNLLESWEEPQGAKAKATKRITIGSILQFHQSLTLMSAKYPFTPAFGIADSREACIDAAQEVYERLMLRTPTLDELPFESIALIAKEEDGGSFDNEKAKQLIKVFRPDRNGNLKKLDFVKSVDDVYKSIRLLTANINNSRHTDNAVKSIVDGVFWFFIITFVMQQLGMDPWALLVSLSTIFITFSFMFGNTASKYFDGMLFILLQRPYGVGDRIHFSAPDTETSIDGSSGWIVEELSLHTTTVYWGATNERATISNGALSSFRVINSARSPNATIYLNSKFAIDTSYDKIETFRAAVEQYLKDRPREWLCFVGFRPTEVMVEEGYVTYMTIAQHRQSWQNVGAILHSKAGLVKFLVEVARQLEMSYRSPPLPVALSVAQNNNKSGDNKSGELTPANVAELVTGK